MEPKKNRQSVAIPTESLNYLLLIGFALSFLTYRIWALINFDTDGKLGLWTLGFALDGAACMLLLLISDSIKSFVKTKFLRWTFGIFMIALLLLNFVNFEFSRNMGSFFSPIFSNFVSADDLQTDMAFFVVLGTINWFYFALIFALPLIIYCAPIKYDSERFGRRAIIYSLCFLGFAITASVAHNLNKGAIQSSRLLAQSFYKEGVREFYYFGMSFLEPSSEQEETKALALPPPEELAKLGEIAKARFGKPDDVWPSPNYPLFRMGKAEYCELLRSKGSNDESCRDVPPPMLAAKPKNIILIILESFRGVSFDGLSPVWEGITPKMAKHMKQGAWFSKAFAVDNPTSRAMTSIMCAASGTRKPLSYISDPFTETICIPDILSALGYRSVRLFGTGRNFQNLSEFYMFHQMNEIIEGDLMLSLYGQKRTTWGYSGVRADDKQVFHGAKQWIKEHGRLYSENPFFAVVKTVANHSPWEPPKDERYRSANIGEDLTGAVDTGRMHQLMRYVDDQVDDFINWAKSPESGNLLDDSIIIVSSDHPPWFLEPKFDIMPEPMKESWIPLFILGLDKEYNKKYDHPVTTKDIGPTIMDLLGVNPPNSFTGKSVFDNERTYGFSGRGMGMFFYNNKVKSLGSSSWKGGKNATIDGDLNKLENIRLSTKEEARDIEQEYELISHLENYEEKNLVERRRHIPENFTTADLTAIYKRKKMFITHLVDSDPRFFESGRETSPKMFKGDGTLVNTPKTDLAPGKYIVRLKAETNRPVEVTFHTLNGTKFRKVFDERYGKSLEMNEIYESSEWTRQFSVRISSSTKNQIAIETLSIEPIPDVQRASIHYISAPGKTK
jgi:phosphoglycerol transferase MdoB-like AlkP superfamily enzyme